MLAITFFQSVIAVLFILVCILLIVVILLQKGRGGGLSGAFGGVGGHSAFGAKTGDVFTWITVALTLLFVLTAVVGVWTFVPPPDRETPQAEITAPGDMESQGRPPASQPGG